jgi:hypothetical protein
VWMIEECGHLVCDAIQSEMKYKSKSGCSVCKKEFEEAPKMEKAKGIVAQEVQADIPQQK